LGGGDIPNTGLQQWGCVDGNCQARLAMVFFSDTLRIMACCYLFEGTCLISKLCKGRKQLSERNEPMDIVIFWDKGMKRRDYILCHLLNENWSRDVTSIGSLKQVVPRYFSAYVLVKLTEKRLSSTVSLGLDERARHKSFVPRVTCRIKV
jgi:hypothetical protein